MKIICELAAEIPVLRHQINVLQQRAHGDRMCVGSIVLYSFGSIVVALASLTP